MTNIVVDKCFLQGSKADAIHKLASSHRLLVTDGLMYELLSTSPAQRSRCFAKFPGGENPVDLVSHIGTLMRYELDERKPAGKPSEHRISFRYQFNAGLVDMDFAFAADVRAGMDDLFHRLRQESEELLEMAMTTADFFPGLIEGSEEVRAKARADAEALIVCPGSLRPFLSSLEFPAGFTLPDVEKIDEQWAIYRWAQVKMLFALDIYVRYQGRKPVMGNQAWTNMEHDVLDAELLALACLEGGFATRERKLIHWWRLLRPDGLLIS